MRFIPLVALTFVLAAPSAATAQTSQVPLPQYNGQTPVDCSQAPGANASLYPCQYPDGSFVWWLQGTTDWTMLTYRNGPCGPPPDPCGVVHVTQDGAAYYKAHPESRAVAPGAIIDTTPTVHTPITVTRTGAASITPIPEPGSEAVGPSIPPDAVAPGHELDYLNLFVGMWYAHENVLEVHDDGSATEEFPATDAIDPGHAPTAVLTFQFTSTTPTVATAQVVASTSAYHSVGETWTFTLNDNDTLTPTSGGADYLDLCGPTAPANWCGA